MKIFRIFVCVGLFVLSAVAATFAQNNQAKLPETVFGQRIAAYLAAFNSGNEGKMRAFFTENVSEENLKRRPIDARLEVYRGMRSELQSLTLRRVVESKPEKVSILVQNQRNEWLRFDFMFEPQPPHKLLGIAVDERIRQKRKIFRQL